MSDLPQAGGTRPTGYTAFTGLVHTGTGNSLRAARWFAETARRQGVKGRVDRIEVLPEGLAATLQGTDLLGLFFPTHGFTAPWHVFKTAFRLPRGKGRHVVCVATRASIKAGRVLLPGLAGTAALLVGLLLLLRGYRVRGIKSVDMPSNWYSLHPIQREASLRTIIGRSEERILGFAARVLGGDRVLWTGNNLYEAIGGLLLLPLSAAYLLAGRFFLAKLFFANGACDGCGICARSCPVSAIRMLGNARPRPFWRYNCESCMRCAACCPKDAIEAGWSWAVILYFATSIPLSYYLISWLGESFPAVASLKGSWTGRLVDLLYYYPSLVLAYWLFFWLNRLGWINWVFAHTTLTHFWGRYLEPDTSKKDLRRGREGRS